MGLLYGCTEHDACSAFHRYRQLLDRVAMPALMDEKILQELGAPPGYKAVAPLIFGYPKDKTQLLFQNEESVK